MYIKIGIIAHKDLQPSYKIQDVFLKLWSQFGPTLQVFTTATTAVENQIKKLSLEKNLKYGEFNPAHTAQTTFSVLPESYYGKRFHPTHEPDMFIQLFRHVDRVLVFWPRDLDCKKFVKLGEKHKTKIVIINP